MQKLLMMNEHELVYADAEGGDEHAEFDYADMLDALIKIRSWRDCAEFSSAYAQILASSELLDAKNVAEYVASTPTWEGCPDMEKLFKFSLAVQLSRLDSGIGYLDHSCFVYRNPDGSEARPFLHQGKMYKGVSYRASLLDLPEPKRAQITPGSPLHVVETRSLFEMRDFFELLMKLIAVANDPSIDMEFAQVGRTCKVQFSSCENGSGVYAYPLSLDASGLHFLYPDVDETHESARALGLASVHKTLWGRVVESHEKNGTLFIGCGVDPANFEKARQRVCEHPNHYGLNAFTSGAVQVVVLADGRPDEEGLLDYDHAVPRSGENATRLVCWAVAKCMIEEGCGRKRPGIVLRETGASAFKTDAKGCLTEMLGEAACELASGAKVSLCLTCKRPIAMLKGGKSPKYCGDTCKTKASTRRREARKIEKL